MRQTSNFTSLYMAINRDGNRKRKHTESYLEALIFQVLSRIVIQNSMEEIQYERTKKSRKDIISNTSQIAFILNAIKKSFMLNS